ncbi:hypothetical protein A2U01_0057252, partial [Trifolium medium]|nr:hypothetical protein [Trifolium medium]
ATRTQTQSTRVSPVDLGLGSDGSNGCGFFCHPYTKPSLSSTSLSLASLLHLPPPSATISNSSTLLSPTSPSTSIPSQSNSHSPLSSPPSFLTKSTSNHKISNFQFQISLPPLSIIKIARLVSVIHSTFFVPL